MDKTLIDAIHLMTEGKEEGFNKVYSETYNHVYFRAKSYMKNDEDALDLVQIVYVEAYRNIGSLQTPEALYGWLDGITYRQGMKQYRKKKDVLLTEEGEGIFETLETEDISSMPELTADQKETSKIIRELVEELPVLQKIAMIAYYFDNLSVGQIAEIQECSEGTVKSRLNYGRKYLKDRIEEKEKKEGYRLHVFTLPTLYFAIKMLAEDTTMTVQAAQGVYNASCAATGLTAGTIATSSVAASAATGTTQAVVAEAGKTAGIGAKFASLSTGMKAAVIATTLAVGTASVGGAVYVATNQAIAEDTVLDDERIESTLDEIDEVVIPEIVPVEEDLSLAVTLAKKSDDGPYVSIMSSTRTGTNEYTFIAADLQAYFENGETVCVQCVPHIMPAYATIAFITYGDPESGEIITKVLDNNVQPPACVFEVGTSQDVIVTVTCIEGTQENEVNEEEVETVSINLSENEKMQIVDAIAYYGCIVGGSNVDFYVSTARSYIQTMQKGDGVNALPCGWTSDIVTEETIKAFYEDGMGIWVPDDYTYNDFGVTCDSKLEGETGADYFKYNSLDITPKEDGTYILTGTFIWGAEGEEDLYTFEAIAVESGNTNVFGGLRIKGYSVYDVSGNLIV